MNRHETQQLLSAAIKWHMAGELGRAKLAYQEVLKADCDNSLANKNLAALLIQQGDLNTAIQLLTSLVQKMPNDPDLLDNLSESFYRLGSLDNASEYANRSVKANPKNSHGFNLLGNIYLKNGMVEEAVKHYAIASDIDPQNPEFLYNWGLALQKSRAFPQAIDRYLAALKLKKDIPEVHNNLALCLLKESKIEQAITHCKTALALRPRYYEGLVTQSRVLLAQGRLIDAKESLAAALSVNQLGVEALVLQSEMYTELGNFDEALSCDEGATRIAPNSSIAWNSMGATLAAVGRTTDAIEAFERATRLDKYFLEAWVGLGNCHSDISNFDSAMACYESALSIDPNCHLARYQIGLLLLRQGHFGSGWDFFSERWKTNAPEFLLKYQDIPRLSDTNSKANRVLLWTEQGVGENLLFGSLLPECSSVGHALTVSIDKRLISAFSRAFPEIEFVPRDFSSKHHEFDAQLPLGDLGGVFRTSKAAFDRQSRAYLLPRSDRFTHWNATLKSDALLNVGLCWSSKNPKFGADKSLALASWAHWLNIQGVRIINLQYDASESELQTLSMSKRFVSLPGVNLKDDFEEVMAITASCDVVVSVSSALAHLCGAAGAPALVLLPKGQGRFWYWGIDANKCLWYPSLTLINQQRQGDWVAPIQKVTDYLLEMRDKKLGSSSSN